MLVEQKQNINNLDLLKNKNFLNNQNYILGKSEKKKVFASFLLTEILRNIIYFFIWDSFLKYYEREEPLIIKDYFIWDKNGLLYIIYLFFLFSLLFSFFFLNYFFIFIIIIISIILLVSVFISIINNNPKLKKLRIIKSLSIIISFFFKIKFLNIFLLPIILPLLLILYLIIYLFSRFQRYDIYKYKINKKLLLDFKNLDNYYIWKKN